MTVSLLGMELGAAQNLLFALNIKYAVCFYYAKKPLPQTDSVRVIRQREKSDRVELIVCAFKTKIDSGFPKLP